MVTFDKVIIDLKTVWLEWDVFNPLCPLGHDYCDIVQINRTYIYCYECKKKYFKEDYIIKKLEDGETMNPDELFALGLFIGIIGAAGLCLLIIFTMVVLL